ncbi:MAG: acetyl-CoA carboxylase biotin carboxyl carrier protein [Terriglobales bacterium]
MTMNAKELKELIEFLIEKDISEFELERGDVKMRMKRGGEPQYVAAPAPPPGMPMAYAPPPALGVASAPATASPASSAPAAAETAEDAGLQTVRSPIVGTFYEAPSPGAAPFVKIGDTVRVGQVLCIIEAMKLMNEIEADVAGTIVKRFVENAQPVEYGQALFAIRTGS